MFYINLYNLKQVGDPFHMFYINLYNLKSTQEEDSERGQCIAQALVRRLIRLQDEVRAKLRPPSDPENNFVEGLCCMLGGMNAATSRYVVSATMGHLLICQKGTRFMFSHDFSDLLIGQLESTLEDKPVDFRVQINRHKNRRIAWKDILAHDYIHRPENYKFNNMCSYELFMRYKEKYLSFAQMNQLENACSRATSEDVDDTEDNEYFERMADQFSRVKYAFKASHPGARFSHLVELKKFVILKISLPEGKLCDVELLKVNDKQVDEVVQELH